MLDLNWLAGSFDSGLRWGQLQPPTESHMKRTQDIHRRFLGDPSFVNVQKAVAADEVEEDLVEEKFTEEKRLAATIRLIVEEASLFPVGAFYRDGNAQLTKNGLFAGIVYLV